MWGSLLWIKHRKVSAKRSICESLSSYVIKETNMPLYEQVELLMVFLTSLDCLPLIMVISNVYLI